MFFWPFGALALCVKGLLSPDTAAGVRAHRLLALLLARTRPLICVHQLSSTRFSRQGYENNRENQKRKRKEERGKNRHTLAHTRSFPPLTVDLIHSLFPVTIPFPSHHHGRSSLFCLFCPVVRLSLSVFVPSLFIGDFPTSLPNIRFSVYRFIFSSPIFLHFFNKNSLACIVTCALVPLESEPPPASALPTSTDHHPRSAFSLRFRRPGL